MCYIHEWESGRVSILDSSFLHYNVVSCANPYPRVAIYYCVIVKDSSQLCNNSNVKVGVDARDYVSATLVCPAVPVSYTTTVCVDMQACMYVHVEGCMRKSECIVRCAWCAVPLFPSGCSDGRRPTGCGATVQCAHQSTTGAWSGNAVNREHFS